LHTAVKYSFCFTTNPGQGVVLPGRRDKKQNSGTILQNPGQLATLSYCQGWVEEVRCC